MCFNIQLYFAKINLKYIMYFILNTSQSSSIVIMLNQENVYLVISTNEMIKEIKDGNKVSTAFLWSIFPATKVKCQ